MDEKLKPALLYAFWVDSKNLTELIRPWYAKKLGVPQCFYYPGKYAAHASAVVESRVGVEADDVHRADVEAAIYREAQECLTILSRRLGETDPYFFGKAPSSADAMMYGYLASLLKTPLPNPTALQAHLKACDNLVSFVSRISLNYFPQALIDYERLQRESNSSKEKRDNSRNKDSEDTGSEKPLSEKLRPIMAGSFAIAAMLGYAHLSGLLNLFKDLDLNISLTPNRTVDNSESEENDR
jgi:metaxin